MAFTKKKFGKKGDFTSIGNMFKSDKEYIPNGATFSYATTCGDKYLTAVVEALTKIHEAGGAARFSLIKWNDNEHPRLTVSPAKSKAPGKRIGKAAEDDSFQEQEDAGL